MGKQVIEYPSWHDDARRMRAETKMTVVDIAEAMGVSASRMSTITSGNWKTYLVMFNRSGSKGTRTLGAASANTENYEFVPKPEKSPAEREALRQKEKSAVKPRPNFQEEDPMAREREFEVSKKLHEGKMLVGAIIKCSSCDATAEYFNYKGSVTPSHLPKEFTRMGWLVAKSPRADKCPSCLAKLKGTPVEAAKPKIEVLPTLKPEEVPVTLPVPTPVPAFTSTEVSPPVALVAAKAPDQFPQIFSPKPDAAPAKPPFVPHITTDNGPDKPVVTEMTRTDRRIIFAKLDEVYIDETHGYRDDWDDDKVAQDLGVPISWVRSVRASDFGPEISAKTKQASIAELNTMIGENNRLIVLIDKKLEQMQALDAKLKTALEEVDAAISRAEELSKNIETEDKHMEALLASFDTKADAFKKKYSEFSKLASA